MRVMADEIRTLERLIRLHRSLSDPGLGLTMWWFRGVTLMEEPRLGEDMPAALFAEGVWTRMMLDEVWRLGR